VVVVGVGEEVVWVSVVSPGRTLATYLTLLRNWSAGLPTPLNECLSFPSISSSSTSRTVVVVVVMVVVVVVVGVADI
jgi:hypothetical protein